MGAKARNNGSQLVEGSNFNDTAQDVEKIEAAAGPSGIFENPSLLSPLVLRKSPSEITKPTSSVSMASVSSTTPLITPFRSSPTGLQEPPSTIPTRTLSSNPNRLEAKKLKKLERDHAHAIAALCLPMTSKKPNQIEIGKAWEKIKRMSTFEVYSTSLLASSNYRADGWNVDDANLISSSNAILISWLSS